MIIFGLFQFLVMFSITFYEYKNKSPIVFMWATLLIMFGVMHTISYLISGFLYDSNVLDTASYFALLFCGCYIITRVLCLKINNINKKILNVNLDGRCIDRNNIKLVRIFELLLLCSVIIYAYIIINASGSLFNVSKSHVYEAMASGGLLYLLCFYVHYATAPILMFCLVAHLKWDCLFVMLLVVIRTLLSSSRMDMIIIFVCILFYLVLKQDKHSIKNIILLGGVGITAIFFVYALRVFRYYYSFSTINDIKIGEFAEHWVNFFSTDDGELGLRRVFYFFIKNNNNFDGFGNGNGYKRLALFAIPSRFSFGLKPEDMCFVMGRAWRPDFSGIIQYSVTPTLLGDCYANFGFSGCLLGVFWAIVGTITDLIVKRRNIVIRMMLCALIGVEFVDIARGSVYNPICHIWYCCIFITAIIYVSRIHVFHLHIKIRSKR